MINFSQMLNDPQSIRVARRLGWVDEFDHVEAGRLDPDPSARVMATDPSQGKGGGCEITEEDRFRERFAELLGDQSRRAYRMRIKNA